MKRVLAVLVLPLLVAACEAAPLPTEAVPPGDAPAASAAVGAGIPLHATVRFGRDDVGSPFPPPSGHDASGHARDKMFPRTVVIRSGGSVTFEMGTFHQVAIYDRGVEPGGIEVSPATLVDLPVPFPPFVLPDFIIDDPADRLAVGPFSFAPMTWTSPPGTFDAPGRYLVLCRVTPHFVEFSMYGWVIVK